MPQSPNPIMDQLLPVALTVLGTVLSGVVVLVLGQLVTRFYLEPLQRLVELRARIATSLSLYANVYGSNDLRRNERADEASATLRQHACELKAYGWTLSWTVMRLGAGLRREDVLKASECLIGLSNSMYDADHQSIHEREKTIKRCLRLHEA